MLATYLKSKPPTRLVLIQDCLEHGGEAFVKFLIKNHNFSTVSYWALDGSFARKCKNIDNVRVIDFGELNSFISNRGAVLGSNHCIIVDSLSTLIYKYGLVEAYRLVNNLIKSAGAAQVIALLHTDLLEDSNKVGQVFEHLATLSILLEPSLQAKSRVVYKYKKSAGKILKKVEEYKFENGNLTTEAIKKPDVKQLIEEGLPQVEPENLATFRIGLTEEEKESRDQLVLPYLPKNEESSGGNIFYKFDNIDDWDEEDPDDDLDL